MYRIHLVLHISTFFPFLFPRLNRGMYGDVSHLVYLCPEEVIMGCGMHCKWEILSSCKRHEASECVELVLKKEQKTDVLLSGTCWRILVSFPFSREVQTSAQSCSTQKISVLSVCGKCLLYMLYNVLGGGAGGGCRGKGRLLSCCHCYCGPDKKH